MPKQRKGEEREQAKEPAKRGRPSLYSEELTDTICERIALGESLRAICRDGDMPAAFTVIRWLANPEYTTFRDQYAHAREVQADTMADEILEISDYGINDKVKGDDGKVIIDQDVIARSRLRVDARKWLASKMAPKKYGDKIDHTVANPDGTNLSLAVHFVSAVKPE